MSIIERALGKQRTAGHSEGEAGQHVRRGLRSNDLVSSAADRARARREPSARIELDLNRLKAGGVLPPEEAADRLQEQVRRIKLPILETAMSGNDSAEAPRANLVMVTSAVAAEGKSYVSFNVALGIAREKDLSVLLVDADVAKRHLSEVLKVDDRPGIVDAVADGGIDPEDLVLGTDFPGLLFLPAGRRTSTAPELFTSHRMAQILGSLGRADLQRIVLFDSSPLLLTNEAPVLARLVDQVVVVVRAEATLQPVVLEAINLLDNTKTLRCVLNQTRMSSLSEHYYGYGYYPYGPAKGP